MLRNSVTLLLVYSLLTLSLATPAISQQNVPAKDLKDLESRNVQSSPDIKKAIAENNKRYASTSEQVDVKELNKIDRQQQKKGWTGKQKLAVVAIIVGVAALIFVAVKYGKECLRYEPEGCDPNSEYGSCTCKEYKQNL